MIVVCEGYDDECKNVYPDCDHLGRHYSTNICIGYCGKANRRCECREVVPLIDFDLSEELFEF